MNIDGLTCRPTRAGVRVDIRVTPRASRTRLQGVRHGRVIVAVTAPPVDGAANAAAARVLAETLGVPRGAVRIVSGETGRDKVVEVAGLAVDAVERCLRSHPL
jgi:uncharacterized protein (TIGR00251 family)